MAPKRRNGKKGGKRKKKGKKTKPEIDPPPLHDLTKLYNLLKEKVGHLEEMRVMSRKKRLEAWFMMREMSSLKSDNEIYHDYLEDNINELHELIATIMESIEKERESIQKEIDRLLAELNKRLTKINKRIEEVEEALAHARMELLQFEPLMAKLAKMLAKLEQLAKDIAAAELEADIKTRHLKNQFLFERAKLHNHLEKQLYDLIQNCRSYIMPILWHHMKKTQFQNACARWRLAKADAKNIRLGEQRDELMLKRKLLSLETNYLGVDWAILKLAEVQVERRKKLRESKKLKKPPPEEPPTELALAFNIYLKKRLTAYHEAKKRRAKAKKLVLEQRETAGKPRSLADSAPEYVELDAEEEEEEEEDQWEDMEEEMEGEDWEPHVKRPQKKHRHRRPKYFSGGEDESEEDEEEEEGSSSSSSYTNSNEEEEEEGEDLGPLVTRIRTNSKHSTPAMSQKRHTSAHHAKFSSRTETAS